MTEYVHLRRSSDPEKVLPNQYFIDHPRAIPIVEKLAKTLMIEWFPRTQPVGEDLENWLDIARSDALLAVRGLISMGLLSDIDSAKVYDHNDE